MQFGIFSVSDITRDPVSGQTPTEAERIDAIVRIAQKTEEVGLDVFAIGEHHNPPFFSSLRSRSSVKPTGSSPARPCTRQVRAACSRHSSASWMTT